MKINIPVVTILALASSPALAQVGVPTSSHQSSAQPTFEIDATTGLPVSQAPYKNIVGNGTTTVKTGAGFLHTLTLGTLIASESIAAYDNTSGNGTLIANITEPSTITGADPVTLTIDAAFSTGLTIVTSGNATSDVTVSYH